MFQMMNEARIMVGLNGVATASVAYHEALAYARERARRAGPLGARRPGAPQVPIIEHADVRRMLLAPEGDRRGRRSRSSPPPRCTPISRRTPRTPRSAGARRCCSIC